MSQWLFVNFSEFVFNGLYIYYLALVPYDGFELDMWQNVNVENLQLNGGLSNLVREPPCCSCHSSHFENELFNMVFELKVRLSSK